MTKEEALKIWLPIILEGVKTMPLCKEALEMAIKALEREEGGNLLRTKGHAEKKKRHKSGD